MIRYQYWTRKNIYYLTVIAVFCIFSLLLQVNEGWTQLPCQRPPCDCKGSFENPPKKLSAQELENKLVDRRSWLQKEDSAWQYWSTQDQINQYDPKYNPPDTGVGKYPCRQDRNGAVFLDKLDLSANPNAFMKFSRDTLAGACLRKSDLHGVNLNATNLSGVNLYRADLSGASLVNADLSGAILDCANLRGADLTKARLINTNLYRAALGGALFYHVQMDNARFEPIELPPSRNFYGAEGLEMLHYEQDSGGIFSFRNELKASGHEDQARRLTYSIMKEEERNVGLVEGYLRWIAFDLTSEYGLRPWRPIGIIFFLIVGFSPLYMVAVHWRSSAAGIWRELAAGYGEEQDREGKKVLASRLSTPLWGLYFSLLSAFNIGWHEIDVADWISRVSPYDYVFRARGWVKVISGIQSLISVYLIALWALTYFGHPFS